MWIAQSCLRRKKFAPFFKEFFQPPTLNLHCIIPEERSTLCVYCVPPLYTVCAYSKCGVFEPAGGVTLAVPTVTSAAVPIESEACPAGADKTAICVVTVVGTLPIADLTLIHICTHTHTHTHTVMYSGTSIIICDAYVGLMCTRQAVMLLYLLRKQKL